MTKAVIFDVDGTLVDSVDLHTQAWVDAFRDFGHDVAFQDMRREIGKGGDQLIPVFLSQAEIAEKGTDLEAHRGKLFKARYLQEVTGFARVRPLFQRLIAEGLQVAVASSAKEEELGRYKEIAGVSDLIRVETSSDDAQRSKPHPDIFEAAMARLQGVEAKDVLVVGDTPHDAEAARKAGLRTIGVTCGGWSEAALREAGCVAVYSGPANLLANLESSPIATEVDRPPRDHRSQLRSSGDRPK